MPALEELKPQPAVILKEDGEFVDFGWRPIFVEHERDGVKYTPSVLREIVEPNNQRLIDSNDFCPAILRHTKDEAEGDDPVVAGYFGPYKLGKVGDKCAVYARMRIYNEYAEPVRKRYTRCSVELWGSKDGPGKSIFDPVALMGADTPYLDLGTYYAKWKYKRSGKPLTRYTMTAPTATNVAMAEPKRYSGENGMDEDLLQTSGGGYQLDPEMVKALVPVMMAVVEEVLAARNEPVGDIAAPPVDMSNDVPGDGAVVDDVAVDTAEAESPVGDSEPPMEPDGDEGEKEEKKDEGKEGEPEKYGLEMGDNQLAERAESAKERYSREASDLRIKYSKLEAEHRNATAELEKKSKELEDVLRMNRHNVRYSRFQQLEAEGIQLDAAEEAEAAQDLTDAQFNAHFERIKTRYARVPQGTIPVAREVRERPTQESTDEAVRLEVDSLHKRYLRDGISKDYRALRLEAESNVRNRPQPTKTV